MQGMRDDNTLLLGTGEIQVEYYAQFWILYALLLICGETADHPEAKGKDHKGVEIRQL